MPMQLPGSALCQMLLRSSNIRTGREIRHDLFTRPSTIEDLGLGIAEAPFQIWYCSCICGLLAETIGVL